MMLRIQLKLARDCRCRHHQQCGQRRRRKFLMADATEHSPSRMSKCAHGCKECCESKMCLFAAYTVACLPCFILTGFDIACEACLIRLTKDRECAVVCASGPCGPCLFSRFIVCKGGQLLGLWRNPPGLTLCDENGNLFLPMDD